MDAGGTVELVCHVSGSPVEEVRWVKDGRKVRSDGRVTVRPKEVLRVSGLQPSDAGLYQCSASHGSHYAHAHARVTLGGEERSWGGQVDGE